MKTLLRLSLSLFEPEDSLPWNLNIADRILRLFAGGILFTTPLYVQGPVTWQIPLLSFTGLYFGMTGFLGWDPLQEFVDRKLERPSNPNAYSSFPRQVLAITGVEAPGTKSARSGTASTAQADKEKKGYQRAA